MRVLCFKDLYFTDFHIRRLFAVNQRWGDGREYTRLRKGRETSALLYLKDCTAVYKTGMGKTETFPCGSVVYIPQGSCYSSRFFACNSTYAYTQLIEFELLDESFSPFACSEDIQAVVLEGKGYYAELFEQSVKLYNNAAFSCGRLKSVLYDLIARISRQHQRENIYSKSFCAISPAIDYLDKNPCANVPVATLAKLCNVSESCFRMLFKKYSGKTPFEYCLANRMKLAKQLLQSDVYSVGEVASLLGYTDPGYFTKVFKKETGCTPSEYAQRK